MKDILKIFISINNAYNHFYDRDFKILFKYIYLYYEKHQPEYFESNKDK